LTESGTLPAGLPFINGVLSGTFALSSAGSYTFSVKATDAEADQATEHGYTLNIAAPPPPGLKIGASPDSLRIIRSQTGQTTITFTPSGGYTGTLELGCSGLPANSACVFSQNGASIHSATFTGNNQPVIVLLTFETDVVIQVAQLGATPSSTAPGAILTAIAFWWPGSLTVLALLRSQRKVFAKSQRWFGLCLLVVLTGTVAAGLAGCIGGGRASISRRLATPRLRSRRPQPREPRKH
jgi:hypothetical protein